MSTAVTLKHLADMLSLSQTTVSRALNGYDDVSHETRGRVREAAERLGYRPSARARSLATGRTRTIGHIVPVTTEHEVLNPVFAEFLIGSTAALAQAGYNTLLRAAQQDVEAEVYRDLAAQRAVDGLIVHGPRLTDPRIALLRALGLPFIVHGRVLDSVADCAWVDVDDVAAMRRGAEHLLDLGHRRIGLVNGPAGMSFAVLRAEGWRRAMAARGLAADEALHAAADMTEPFAHRAAHAMLDGPAPPTAILTASIVSALGVARAARERGLTLGRELSLVAYDDVITCLDAEGAAPFTTLRAPVRRAGARCAALLLRMLADPSAPPPQELTEATLIRGASTGPASG